MTLPKDVRELARFASDAVNAWLRGLPIPVVALQYRYEPVTAIIVLRNLCSDYGEKSVESVIPAHVCSIIAAYGLIRR